MNGMEGEVVDGSGTIDPANLSNSGTCYRFPLRFAITCLLSRGLPVQSYFHRDSIIRANPTRILSVPFFFLRFSSDCVRAYMPFRLYLHLNFSAFSVAHLQTDTPASLWSTGTIPC